MLEYTLFGRQVIFQTASERFFDLQYAGWVACEKAKREFNNWYDNCKSIENVLHGYRGIVGKLIESLAIQPLYAQLKQYEIYDVSKDAYCRLCVDYSETENALQYVARKYDAIQSRKEEAIEYRAARKAGRSRWQGGGFGFSGAMKGAAMAGGMNLLSGMGHSFINAVGNAGSSMEAAGAARKLYAQAEIKELLCESLNEDLFSIYLAHADLVNSRKQNCICNTFDPERAEALFENAKLLPQKRKDLLPQALELCPWNDQLVQYIFINFPEERKEASILAKRFHVDLSDIFEDILKKEYTEDARRSEEAAQRAKARIKSIMQEYHISESATLDQLECDCMERICKGYEQADIDTCFGLIRDLETYDALEKNKSPYIQRIQQRIGDIWKKDLQDICKGYAQADEAACNKMKDAVLQYGAPDEYKQPFLESIKQRIEEIWSNEDSAAFTKLYLDTDITNADSVKKTVENIEKAARTSASESYISALKACDSKNIQKARTFRRGVRPKIYAVLGLVAFLLAISNLLYLHYGIPATICGVFVSLIFAGLYGNLSQSWKLLTLDDTVLHPVLIENLPESKKKIPSVVIAILIVAILTIIISGAKSGNTPSDGNIPDSTTSEESTEEYTAETQKASDHSTDETQASPADLDTADPAIEQARENYMVTGEDGIEYNRYLGEDYQVHWYYDHAVDESGTEEFLLTCPDKTELANIFDCAISLGIDASDYIRNHVEGSNISSDPEPVGTENSMEEIVPPSITDDEIAAAISVKIPDYIGKWKVGSGTVSTENDPRYISITQCEIEPIRPDLYDTSAISVDMMLHWTESDGWEPTEFTAYGTVTVNFAGTYTVWTYGETQSTEITISPTAYIDPEGTLVFQGVSVLYDGEIQNMDLLLHVFEHPERMVATNETGSIYYAFDERERFYFHFDIDMVPTFFSYDP